MAIRALESLLREWREIDRILRAATQPSFQRWPFDESAQLEREQCSQNVPCAAGTQSRRVSPSKTPPCHSCTTSLKNGSDGSSSSPCIGALEMQLYNCVYEYFSYFRKVESFTHLLLLKEMLRISVTGWLSQISRATRGLLKVPKDDSSKQRRCVSSCPISDVVGGRMEALPNVADRKSVERCMEETGDNRRMEDENRFENFIPWKSEECRTRWIRFTKHLQRQWCKTVRVPPSFRTTTQEDAPEDRHRRASQSPTNSSASLDRRLVACNSAQEKDAFASAYLHAFRSFFMHYQSFYQFLTAAFSCFLNFRSFTEILLPTPLRLLEETLTLEVRRFLAINSEKILLSVRFAVDELLSAELRERNEKRPPPFFPPEMEIMHPKSPRRHLGASDHAMPPLRNEFKKSHTFQYYVAQLSPVLFLVEVSQLEGVLERVGDMIHELSYVFGAQAVKGAFDTKRGWSPNAMDDEAGMASRTAAGEAGHWNAPCVVGVPFSSPFTWSSPASAYGVLYSLWQCVDGYRFMHDLISALCEGNRRRGGGTPSLSFSADGRVGTDARYSNDAWRPFPTEDKKTEKGRDAVRESRTLVRRAIGHSPPSLHAKGKHSERHTQWFDHKSRQAHLLPPWEQVLLQKALTGYWAGVASHKGWLSVIQKEGVLLWRLSCERQLYHTHKACTRRDAMSTRRRRREAEQGSESVLPLLCLPHPLWCRTASKGEDEKEDLLVVPAAPTPSSSAKKADHETCSVSIPLQKEEFHHILPQKTGKHATTTMYDALLAVSAAEGYPSMLFMLFSFGPSHQKFITALQENIANYLTDLLQKYDEEVEAKKHGGSSSSSSPSPFSTSFPPLPAPVLEECIYLLKMNRLCFENVDVQKVCGMASFMEDLCRKETKSGEGCEASSKGCTTGRGVTTFTTLSCTSLENFASDIALSGIRKFFSTCERRVADTLAHALDSYAQVLIRKKRISGMTASKRTSAPSGDEFQIEETSNPTEVVYILLNLASLLADASIFSKFYADLLSPRALVANSISELAVDHWVVHMMEFRLGFLCTSSCVLLLRDVQEAIEDWRSERGLAFFQAKQKGKKARRRRGSIIPTGRNLFSPDCPNASHDSHPMEEEEDDHGEKHNEERSNHSPRTLQVPLGSIRSLSAKPNYLLRKWKVLRISRWRSHVTLLESSRSIQKMYERGNWFSEAVVDSVMRAEWYYHAEEAKSSDHNPPNSSYSGYKSFRMPSPRSLGDVMDNGRTPDSLTRGMFQSARYRRTHSDWNVEDNGKSSIARISKSTTSLVAGLSNVLSSAVQQATTQTRGFTAFTRNASLGNDDSDEDVAMNGEQREEVEERESLSTARSGVYVSPPAFSTLSTASGAGGVGMPSVSQRSRSWFSLSSLTARSGASTTSTVFRGSTFTDNASVNSAVREEEKRKILWALGCGLLTFAVSERVSSAPSCRGDTKEEESAVQTVLASSSSHEGIHPPMESGVGRNEIESRDVPLSLRSQSAPLSLSSTLPCSPRMSVTIHGPPIVLLLMQLLDRASAAAPLTFNQIISHLPLRVPKPIIGQILKKLLVCGIVERILHAFANSSAPHQTNSTFQYGYYLVEHFSSSIPREVHIVVHYRVPEDAPLEESGAAYMGKHRKKKLPHSPRPPLSAFARTKSEESGPSFSSPPLNSESLSESGCEKTGRETSSQVVEARSRSERNTSKVEEMGVEERRKVEQLKREKLHVAIARVVKKETVITHEALFASVSANMEVNPIQFKNAIAFLLEREHLYRCNEMSYCINKPDSAVET